MNPRFEVMHEGARANMIEWGTLAETVTSTLVEDSPSTKEPETPTINVTVPECNSKEDGDDDAEEQGTQV